MILAKNVLVAMAHADDAELGAGATIARLVEEGCNVHCVAFSRSEVSLPKGAPGNTLEIEARNSAKVLGINSYDVLGFETRKMPGDRQKILQAAIDIGKKVNPGLVITHSIYDCHQDHQAVANEIVRAFKGTTIIGAIHTWNLVQGQVPNFFVRVRHRHIAKQIEAIGEYRSQSAKQYCRPSVIRGQLEANGLAIRARFAQKFHLIRGVV